MPEMRVMAVGVEPAGQRPVLLLEEASGDHRLLPVWIGAAEANVIILEQRGLSAPRPLTHQLIGHVLTSFGRRLEQVRITELRQNIFHAELILDRDTRVGNDETIGHGRTPLPLKAPPVCSQQVAGR